MIDRMNRTMVAETPEEKEMASLLNRANNSEMLENYAEALKQELQKNINISFYSYRVKKVHSAIRSFRIAKFQKLEQMHDLFGVLVVVDNEESDILANLKKIMAHTENLEKVLPPLK